MRKGEVSRQEILAEAAQMVSEVGFSGVTIGALAERTGRSKSGLFAHFRSKEALQLQVLQYAIARFMDVVVRPTLAAPRGEPRVRALFEHKLRWNVEGLPGGCVFIQGSVELDDQPGPLRDLLVRSERDWLDTMAQVFRTGISEGHFRAGADPGQFAHDLTGVMFAHHHALRLLHDPDAGTRARRAFEALLADARVPEPDLTRT